MSLAFVDTETTGLDPVLHEIWEVAAIVDGGEHEWQLPVDLGRADSYALKVGNFRARRYAKGQITPLDEFADEFSYLTRDRHFVGAIPSFDDERLRKLLRANGACPEWHYHLIDVEALAVGYLFGQGFDHNNPALSSLPWDSEMLSRWIDVDPEQFDRHTALGDARWAKAIYERVITSRES